MTTHPQHTFTPSLSWSIFCSFFVIAATVAAAGAGASLHAVGQTQHVAKNAFPPTNVSHRTLTFAERVTYQRAIENVYWRHRIWPTERPDSKPTFDAVMSQVQLEKKVAQYLRNSQALEDYWQRPLATDQLQAEMERMAQHTRQPEMLRELFDALGNDPFIIAECLTRPPLSERLITSWYAYDQRFHGELKQRVEAELQAHPSIKQMKHLSGKYSEIEFVKNDSTRDEDNRAAGHSVKLNTQEWDQTLQKLAAMFGNEYPIAAGTPPTRLPPRKSVPPGTVSPEKTVATVSIKAGVLSSLQEEETRYYVAAVIEKTDDRLKLATLTWRKQPFEEWRARLENQVPITMAAPRDSYQLPKMLEGAACIDDTWTVTAGPPYARIGHTAVWTGSEMIVWGGASEVGITHTGGRYNPSTDIWTGTSTTNAPPATDTPTAVWTGSEMIVWGGEENEFNYPNTGGRYNPASDSWVPTSTANAPQGRFAHTALWIGSEMIVWGGGTINSTAFNTGGRYNPSTDSWIATSTTNAPSARLLQTAILTSSEMIVWGGGDQFGNALNTGGRYNPR